MPIKCPQARGINFHSVANTHAKPFIIIDANYRILAANKAYEQCYGVQFSDISYKPCYEVNHANTQPCSCNGEPCPLEHVFHSDAPFVYTHFHFNRERRRQKVKVSAYPLRGENGELYIGESIEPVDAPENRRAGNDRMVGNSPIFIHCVEQLNLAANSEAPVVLQGKTGTGKELAARYIHDNSTRAKFPFQVIDSTVLTDGLFESEVFGHEQGAYTGSFGLKKGLFEIAEGGTIFLDEIGDLPVSQQAKFLRVLESGQFRRVGGTKNRKTNIRIICATNLHLWERVQCDLFRADLYYRIACHNITLPELKDRLNDIPTLASNLLEGINRSMRKDYYLMREAVIALKNYDYPGNIRELRNILFLAVTSSKTTEIFGHHIESAIDNLTHTEKTSTENTNTEEQKKHNENVLTEEKTITNKNKYLFKSSEVENFKILIMRFQGNRKKMASALGVSERTIYRKLKKLGLH